MESPFETYDEPDDVERPYIPPDKIKEMLGDAPAV